MCGVSVRLLSELKGALVNAPAIILRARSWTLSSFLRLCLFSSALTCRTVYGMGLSTRFVYPFAFLGGFVYK